jgi:hypothetical protein
LYVLDKNGKPIMPTERHGKVRHLLNDKKAKVVCLKPFTIQLLYDTEGVVQDIVLGVDIGSKKVGLSASTQDKEVFSAEVEVRNDVPGLMKARKELRRSRRNRIKRSRAARFNHRTRSEGWLSPTVKCKLSAHVRAISFICKFLPISSIVIEEAAFDTQKLQNPNIEGTEYQHGNQYGSENVKAYVRARDNYTCQHCGKSGIGIMLQVHHIIFKCNGGTDTPDNMVTLCDECHMKLLHKGLIKLDITPKNLGLKHATQVSIISARLKDALSGLGIPVYTTYGYITKGIRFENNIEKSHINDARVITGNLNAKPMDYTYTIRPLRRHFRQLHKANKAKGGKRISQKHHKNVHGFNLYDIVKVNCPGNPLHNKAAYISKLRASGSFSLKDFSGKLITDGIAYKKLVLKQRVKGLMVG